MTDDLDSLTWPVSRLGEAMESLAIKSGLPVHPRETSSPWIDPDWSSEELLGRWIEAAASRLGLEATPVEILYREVELLLRSSGPVLLRLPDAGKARFLTFLDCSRGAVYLLGPDLVVHRLPLEDVRAAMCRDVEGPLIEEIDRLLTEAAFEHGSGRGRRWLSWVSALARREWAAAGCCV